AGTEKRSMFCFVFFSSRRRHTRFSRDWSSDVCSSDLRNGSRILLTEAGATLMESVKVIIHEYELADYKLGLLNNQIRGNLVIGEIGRASCRERVKRQGGTAPCT